MSITIRPIVIDDVPSFRSNLDVVAREAKYLAMLEAPPLESMLSFVRENIAKNNPQFVASNGQDVVGWCDIVARSQPTVRHCGSVGMGVLPAYRGQGLGCELLKACIAKAPSVGITRIELEVRTDNGSAIRLYEKLGFVLEGCRKGRLCIQGEYFDTLAMAIILHRDH
jgi:RimJ/RimL family protein N-acetyltransferase